MPVKHHTYTDDIVDRDCISAETSRTAPKSRSYTFPSGRIMIFEGLMSLWNIFLSWIYYARQDSTFLYNIRYGGFTGISCMQTHLPDLPFFYNKIDDLF